MLCLKRRLDRALLMFFPLDDKFLFWIHINCGGASFRHGALSLRGENNLCLD